MKVVLVASSGGHLTQLWWARTFWQAHERTWVTFDTPHARSLLTGERWRSAHHPTNRSAVNLVRNLAMARSVLRAERPDVVVTTGAGVGVPFVWAARAMRIRSVFIEVFDRTGRPSLTGRLVAPVADLVVLQRPEQRAIYPRGIVLGPVH